MDLRIGWVTKLKEREREKCSQTLRGRSFKSGKFEMVIGSIVFCVLDLRSFNFLYFFLFFETFPADMEIGLLLT